jgi:hypothetical protein
MNNLSKVNPFFWVIWGIFASVFNYLLSIITEREATPSIIGFVFIFVGMFKFLFDERHEKIGNEETEAFVQSIKTPIIRNIVRNIYLAMYAIDNKSRYLCRFITKNSTIYTIFVPIEEDATQYKKWYLDSDNKDEVKILELDGDRRVAKVKPSDIEEFEYQKITQIEYSIINPAKAFLRQESVGNISLKSVTIFIIGTFIFAIGYEHYVAGHLFTGAGSIDTAYSIIRNVYNFTALAIQLSAFVIVLTGFTTYKDSINKYYSKTLARRHSVGTQLLKLSIMPIIFSMLISPSLNSLLIVAQKYGYFLK